MPNPPVADPFAPPPRRPVKIWAVADLHGIDPATLLPPPDGCDVAVIAGDIAPLGDFTIKEIESQHVWMNEVLGRWAASRPDLQIVSVPGEHDVFLNRWGFRRDALRLPKNFHLLIDEDITILGLRFYCTPWIPWSGGKWEFEAKDWRLEQEWYDSIPKGTDVLVCHAAPRVEGLSVDCKCQYQTERMRHLGSEFLTDSISRARPALCVFGHVHSGDHEPYRLRCGTVIRNVSVLDEDFIVSFPPAVFNIKPRSRKRL